jgi:hypothetical protein
MKMLKLAAGFAAGYVLGSRAGREKYEQIAATARKVRENPTVIQAQEKAKGLLGVSTTDTPSASTSGSASGSTTGSTSAIKPPPPPKTESVSVKTPATAGDPLA